jgi:hypothetical protein
MTLKEKILSDNYLEDYDTPITDYQADNIVERADNYAVEFLEWFDKNCYARGENSFLLWANDDEPLTPKELLEIFKKEKGL